MLRRYDPGLADDLLFDLCILVHLGTWVYAVLHNFAPATLGIIAGFGGGALYANLKQRSNGAPRPPQ